ncbi:MAG: Stage V sporulation protein E Required for spore cortex synthesi [Parcubacteria group bacterium Gr01-1014_73]|nr:MAG: Stage V sporulation protein E Required for spore cortex synthesi [Parcubacteria group bacterium Gr01-1014_73]
MKKVDKLFLIIVGLLVAAGLLIFLSAAMGLLVRESGASFSVVALKQILFGLLPGLFLLWGASKVPPVFWRRNAFYIFLFSLVVTALVFVPSLGLEHGGALRWIKIFGQSFQPSELLKIGFVIYFAAWLSGVKTRAAEFKSGLLPLIILLIVVGTLIIAQRDTDTFMVFFTTGLVMYLAGGGKWRHAALLFFGAVLCVIALAFARPYVMERFQTFLNPNVDPQGASYQIHQSLIAIGSGGLTGRGFGQSVRKFNYLPEPMGDSIFAVVGEEFGFVGAVLLILLFTAFAWRGLWIANRSADTFASLTTVGIVTMIMSQSFINMAAMLNILPLSGTPLLFISQGGTALLFALAEAGMILGVSRHIRK